MCGVRAKDTCEAASPNDLSFVIGELMDIVRNPTDEPKWIARKVCFYGNQFVAIMVTSVLPWQPVWYYHDNQFVAMVTNSLIWQPVRYYGSLREAEHVVGGIY